MSRAVIVGLPQRCNQSSNNCAGSGFCACLVDGGRPLLSRSKRGATVVVPSRRDYRKHGQRAVGAVDDLDVVGIGLEGFVEGQFLVRAQVDRDDDPVLRCRGFRSVAGERIFLFSETGSASLAPRWRDRVGDVGVARFIASLTMNIAPLVP